MLTEAEVERNFRRIFGTGAITSDALERAEGLIDQLRLESPLRHRLAEELDELKRLSPVDQ